MIKTVKVKSGRSKELTLPSRAYQKISRALVNSIPYLPSNERYNITISNEKKFVWFRVGKVGSRTIFNIFKQANVYLDADNTLLCHYPVDKYTDYYKFAFIRNPWDRLVSCWQNKVIDSNYFNYSEGKLSKMQSFDEFVSFVADEDIENCDNHFILQSKIIDLNNIDFLGRFENFEKDLLAVVSTFP